MAHSYHPPQTALTGFIDSMQQESNVSAYSLFGPTQYPESVAFWHDPSAPVASAPTYPAKQPTLLQPIDQKKHKRTRSGCFTCRARRVKCDESRPVCDRCRKGARDCVYPSPATSSKAAAARAPKPRGPRPPSQGSDSSSGKVDPDDVSPLEPILDEEEEGGGEEGTAAATRPSPTPTSGAPKSRPDLHKSHSTQSLPNRSVMPASESSSFHPDQSRSPSTESSRPESVSVRSASIGHSLDLLANARLPEDLQFYLNFHQEYFTHHHYFMRPNSTRFIHQSIIELALQYEPLLYAVVGFAAYHHTLHSPGGKLYTFLKYYNKALILLRKSLGSGEEHNEATLVTVLVLTTFEEYIGDWVNLIDHHQAAHALMRELLTPESANLYELHNNIFLWYARFDVVAGILAGTETILSRDWYLAKEQYDAEQAALYPDDPSKQLALVASINRRFGLDMASLYAKLSRGLIPMDEFAVQNGLLGQTIERAKTILKGFNESEYTVRDYPHKQPLAQDDIVDPYVPGGLHRGPLWEINSAWIDILSTETMFKYQTMLALKQPLLPELQTLAFEQCRLIETIDRWPDKESGYCIAFKNSLGIASMFLPKDSKHQMWARRKMALMEQNGYIIAPRFRAGLAAMWQLPEIHYWWLPNDEGYPDIVREIRSMTEERMNQPRDNFRENVRDMKSLFWKLNVDDAEDDQSPASSHSGLP
ncbi:hypothetical protein NUU61_009951 [Penicillium alfredii]|uniref:Zn(2)-C6 fungal-type domain-containing protein n=1 Tax=Penicillium alfredii TaxID=1506179 RepID=A0A9W9EH20_9EURO|nr:uncharacterized protein NUU61_009951 [Penicillium alfredii]KAJ5081687.1 hypothetical protein NUU61_009951 [Penicillium alfredii]